MKDLKIKLFESILSDDDELENRTAFEPIIHEFGSFNKKELEQYNITFEFTKYLVDKIILADSDIKIEEMKKWHWEIVPYWHEEDHIWLLSVYSDERKYNTDASFADIYYRNGKFVCDGGSHIGGNNLAGVSKMVDELNDSKYKNDEIINIFRC